MALMTSTCSLPFTCRFFPKPLSSSLFSVTSLSYGPSLYKGLNPLQNTNEEHFTRIFDINALRVPSQHSFSLENKLRGHLLNWPRIRNIARVPGDDIDDELKEFLVNNDDDDETLTLAVLERRIYGKAEADGEKKMCSVLYRDKIAKSFNSIGYVKFENLAKISRPKKKEKWKREGKRGNGRSDMSNVEVVDQEGNGDDEDFSGLLGDDFRKRRKWSGSTRLLLLDERYTNKGIEEMPEAIKAVLKEHNEETTNLSFEIVRCKLTLFYNYWQMNEVLEVLLPQGMIVPSAFETVGHIAHLNLRDEHLPYKKLIAKVVLDKNKPKIQTVVNKIDVIHNDYRTMQLEVLAGNHSLVTTVVENGLYFNVDLAAVYWNSRLATERQRLLSCFTLNDVVCDVFAGVGPIAIAAAKKVKYVYANDLNPNAVEYLERNCVRNKLEMKIEIFNMDGRRFIDSIFASEKARPITQVVMNLPNDAAEFLDSFRGIFRNKHTDKQFTLPRIHVYGFSKAQDPEFDFHEKIRIALSEVAFEVQMHKVRLVAPGKWMLCASFVLPETVAFAKETL
ncbi:hypothetical protein K7X08_015147 [Anisodus acutangulus]|uniref:tRNA (guanine(37)-N1)-methyltransferase n=1 Tax=Anisodus acutangulus TaxID=402998 RepID=A0A9Q1L511_9SOLA|nr:hypothetical protein K7X08_015147 [Anisodus acutangulus]